MHPAARARCPVRRWDPAFCRPSVVHLRRAPLCQSLPRNAQQGNPALGTHAKAAQPAGLSDAVCT